MSITSYLPFFTLLSLFMKFTFFSFNKQLILLAYFIVFFPFEWSLISLMIFGFLYLLMEIFYRGIIFSFSSIFFVTLCFSSASWNLSILFYLMILRYPRKAFYLGIDLLEALSFLILEAISLFILILGRTTLLWGVMFYDFYLIFLV